MINSDKTIINKLIKKEDKNRANKERSTLNTL